MYRLFVRLMPLAVLLLALSGCGGDDESDTPTDPGPAQKTDSFSGTLTLNGAASYPFSVTAVGSMIATLVDLKRADLPDQPGSPVGLALGTWNGSICQIVLANDATRQGEVVVANSTAVGEFCVRIYDASGTLPAPQTYVIVVDHF